MKRHAWMVVVAAGLAGLLAGVAVDRWHGSAGVEPSAGVESSAGVASSAGAEPAPDMIGRQRPAFELPTVDGEARSIDHYDGRVMLLNFWATWCPPCVEEMPVLDALHERFAASGLRVVGVALDDADAVREFAEVHGIDYPLLVGARDAFDIARAYGNPRGTLPYSVVIDRGGAIRATHQGALTRAEATALVRPHL